MLSPWYITGFCEGQAAFTYSRNSNYNIVLYFAIKLNSDEKDVLTKVKNFFGVGRLYRVNSKSPGRHKNNIQDSIYYRVSRLNELPHIIEHFDQYPFTGRKLKAYQIWREIYYLKIQYKKSVYPKIWQLLNELSSLTSKNFTRKAIK